MKRTKLLMADKRVRSKILASSERNRVHLGSHRSTTDCLNVCSIGINYVRSLGDLIGVDLIRSDLADGVHEVMVAMCWLRRLSNVQWIRAGVHEVMHDLGVFITTALGVSYAQ
jgi:hypothetical protein